MINIKEKSSNTRIFVARNTTPIGGGSNTPSITEDEVVEIVNGAIGDLEAQIDNKQDVLISGENIATINGESLLDGGNIEIPIPSDYVTENELQDTLYNTLNEYVTENELALKGYVNTEDFDRALTEKQDRLVSGEDIKTINGNSILGSGDLIIQGGSGGIQSVVAVDSYPYLSATTTDNAVELRLKMGNMLSGQGGLIDAQSTQEYLTENYYTKTESDDRFQPKGDYLTAVPSEYITETELNNTLTDKNYATKSEIPTVPSNISAFNNDAGYITENVLNGYATTTYVDTQIGDINTILENIIG